MKQKIAAITGITGQDGSFLSEQLLEKGYEVYGLIRRSSTSNTKNIDHIINDLKLVEGDMCDYQSLKHFISISKPDMLFNLAAQSHVHTSYNQTEFTTNVNALGVVRLLNIVRECNLEKSIRFYQAGSSEMFGDINVIANESTLMQPVSPYAISKLYAYHMIKIFRKAYNIFAVCGILFNHESERRGDNFVTMKIVKGMKRIKQFVEICTVLPGLYPLPDNHIIHLGNIEAQRDWGYAPDYTKAMLMMLQNKTPDDYVVCTNESHSIREFIEKCLKYLNLPGKVEDYITIDSDLLRPIDFNLRGDSSKIRNDLGWNSTHSFNDMIEKMIGE